MTTNSLGDRLRPRFEPPQLLRRAHELPHLGQAAVDQPVRARLDQHVADGGGLDRAGQHRVRRIAEEL